MPEAVLDTHALIWYLAGDRRLGEKARAILEDPESFLIVPMIALAEACWIVEHGRNRSVNVTTLLAALDADPRIRVQPFTREVLDRGLNLTAVREMHDRQIVATALVLAAEGQEVVLITRDEQISATGLVPVVW